MKTIEINGERYIAVHSVLMMALRALKQAFKDESIVQRRGRKPQIQEEAARELVSVAAPRRRGRPAKIRASEDDLENGLEETEEDR